MSCALYFPNRVSRFANPSLHNSVRLPVDLNAAIPYQASKPTIWANLMVSLGMSLQLHDELIQDSLNIDQQCICIYRLVYWSFRLFQAYETIDIHVLKCFLNHLDRADAIS